MNLLKLKSLIIATFVVYFMVSPPFIFATFAGVLMRASLEMLLLSLLVIYYAFSQKSKPPVVMLAAWVSISAFPLFVAEQNLRSYLSIAAKIFIIILSVRMASYDGKFQDKLRRLWVALWSVAAVSVILIYINFNFKIFPSRSVSLAEFSETADYNYFGNAFGYYISYRFNGVSVPKINWYLYEPVFLSFFFGLNVVASRMLVKSTRRENWFIVLNLIGGFLTFSSTFILFSVIYLVFKLFRVIGYKTAIIFMSLAFALAVPFMIGLYLGGAFGFTSIGDRMLRFSIAMQIFQENNIIDYIVGNGVNYIPHWADRSASSGLLILFIDLGALISTFVLIVLFVFMRANIHVFLYCMFYSLAMYPFFFPIFMFFLVATFESWRKNKGALDGNRTGLRRYTSSSQPYDLGKSGAIR